MTSTAHAQRTLNRLEAVIKAQGPDELWSHSAVSIRYLMKQLSSCWDTITDLHERLASSEADQPPEAFCTECAGPYDGWLEQYGGHWDTCPNRVASKATDDEREALAWVDKQGDVWIFRRGMGYSFETQPFTREHIEKKWGPLTELVRRGDAA